MLAVPKAERSPYWLGLRVSVVVPTHNRKDKLLACLDALARQSILPQEFEVVVVDDGSTDGTQEALQDRRFPFALRYFRQEDAVPGPRATWASSAPGARSCCSSATTSSPTSDCSRSICSRTPARPSLAQPFSGTSTGRRP